MNQRATVLGPADELRQILLEGVQLIHGVFLSGGAGEQRFSHVHATQVETHLQGRRIGVELGAVCGLDVGYFLPLGAGGSRLPFFA